MLLNLFCDIYSHQRRSLLDSVWSLRHSYMDRHRVQVAICLSLSFKWDFLSTPLYIPLLLSMDTLHSILFMLFILLISVAGIPSQKPKEQQRSVLRPAVLQAPPSKLHIETSKHRRVALSYLIASDVIWFKILMLLLFLCSLSVYLDSTCGTNGVKKSSDETAGSQSLFMNNTEHSTFSANSLVRKTEIFPFLKRKSVAARLLHAWKHQKIWRNCKLSK